MSGIILDMRWDGLEKYSAVLMSALAKSPLLVGRIMYTEAIGILVPAVRQRLRANRNVFRGQLIQRVAARYRHTVTKNSVAVEVGSLGVHYGIDVQEGTPPRTLSPAEKKKIREWVRLKMGRRGKLLDQQTAAVIKTIESSGTKAYPYLDEAWTAAGAAFITSAIKKIEIALAGELGP